MSSAKSINEQPQAELRDQPTPLKKEHATHPGVDLPSTATVIAGGSPQYTKIVAEPNATTTTNLAGHDDAYRHREHRTDKDASLRKKSDKSHHRDGNKDKERPKSDKALLSSPSDEGLKTPKDFNFKFDMHTDEHGKKEVDAKFHFEGKRDHLDDDKEKDKDGKDHESSGDKSKAVGKLAEVIGGKMQERANNKEKDPEIIEPRNAATHAGGMGGKIKQKVKAKIGEALQGAATEMLVHKPGDTPRDLNASIKHHMEQANRLEREAFVEEQMAHDHNLRRAERKEASKRADDAKYRAKVEIATAEAEKHVLESH